MISDKLWLQIAEDVSTASKCLKAKHGAVIVKDGVILSTGYNGTIRGTNNVCGGNHCLRMKLKPGEKVEIGCLHAEANAILNLARQGCSSVGATMYVTGESCLMCAKLIAQAGIKRVVYATGGANYGGANMLRTTYGVEVVGLSYDSLQCAFPTCPSCGAKSALIEQAHCANDETKNTVYYDCGCVIGEVWVNPKVLKPCSKQKKLNVNS